MILLNFLKKRKMEVFMVAIVAMILGYAMFQDVKVMLYIGVGFAMAKWLINSIQK